MKSGNSVESDKSDKDKDTQSVKSGLIDTTGTRPNANGNGSPTESGLGSASPAEPVTKRERPKFYRKLSIDGFNEKLIALLDETELRVEKMR